MRTTRLLAASVSLLLLLGALGHAADSAISTHSTESAGAIPGVSQKRAPINDETRERIRAQPKGTRPDPSTYLTKTYIEQHLTQFEGGCARVMPPPTTEIIGPPGGTFIMPRLLLDELLANSGGNLRKLEDELGLKPGTLPDDCVRIDIPSCPGLRVPSGNEVGANSDWLPGGFTAGGIPEAVVDQVRPGSYTLSILFPARTQ